MNRQARVTGSEPGEPPRAPALLNRPGKGAAPPTTPTEPRIVTALQVQHRFLEQRTSVSASLHGSWNGLHGTLERVTGRGHVRVLEQMLLERDRVWNALERIAPAQALFRVIRRDHTRANHAQGRLIPGLQNCVTPSPRAARSSSISRFAPRYVVTTSQGRTALRPCATLAGSTPHARPPGRAACRCGAAGHSRTVLVPHRACGPAPPATGVSACTV